MLRSGDYPIGKGLMVFEAIFGFSLFITACFAANQCLTARCFEGPGAEALFKVNTGLSFQIISTSILFMLHAAYGFLYVSWNDNPKNFGKLSAFMAFLAVQSIFIWNSMRLIMIDFKGREIVCESQSDIRNPRSNLIGVFNSAMAFSVLLFIVTTIEAVIMIRTGDTNYADESTAVYVEPIADADVYQEPLGHGGSSYQ